MNNNDPEKEKLVNAFKKYVDNLTPQEFSQFDEFKVNLSEGVGSNYVFQQNLNFKSILKNTKLEALKSAERDLIGRTINMDFSKRLCKFETDRRKEWRNINDEAQLEQSVYFSFIEIDNWLKSIPNDSNYSQYSPEGIRIYFAGYENDVNWDGKTYEMDRSTVILRAMYNDNGTIKKIPNRNGDDETLLTYNLGGLCPPECEDDLNID